ncbi:MAG: insulinase family protein [Salinivirgaceae bacterium]|nr:insulinase family protein [Salinivirgaceae bacterium]
MLINRTIQPETKSVQFINIPPVKKITLDNGLPLYILNGGSQDLIKLDVMIPAGANYTNKKLAAPLTGLMLNEGTSSKTAHEIAEAFDFYGAYFQPSIEKDNSNVGLVSLNKHLANTLPVFAEVLLQSTFPEKEFSNLIKRRKQKFLVDSEKTSFVAKELFFEHLFGANHPYGMATTENLYNEIQAEELHSFYKSNYQTANFKLIASGLINESSIQLINQYFGKLKMLEKPQPLNVGLSEKWSSKPIIIKKEDAVQSSIRMGIITINKQHHDYIGLKILTTILGGYFGSRLMKNIRVEKGFSYGIQAMQISLANAGYMAIAADVMVEHTKEAVDEIFKEISKLKTEEVSQNELNLVRNYMMGEMLQMFDGPLSISEAFKGVVEYNLDFSYYKKMKESILNITAVELQNLANKYFNLDSFVTVVAGKY